MTHAKSADLSTGVIVLGVHRSGTSVLTAAMQALGCNIGNFELKVGAENPKGYFEHPKVRLFNDKLFSTLGASWDSWGFYCGDINFSAEEFSDLRVQAHQLLVQCFGGLGMWAVKDPRMTHLLPFWEAVFAEYKLDIRRILIIRDPAEVMESQSQRLKRNPDFHLALSDKSATAALWCLTMLGAVKAVADDRTLVIGHNDLYTKTVKTLQACARFLDLSVSDEKLKDFSDNFFDKALRRAQPTQADAGGAWGVLAQNLFASFQLPLSPRVFDAQQASNIYNQQALLRSLLSYLPPAVYVQNALAAKINKTKLALQGDQDIVLYLSELVDGKPLPFSEGKSVAHRYTPKGSKLDIDLNFPVDLRGLASLRLDICDEPLIVEVHQMSLYSADGRVLWQWDVSSAVFSKLTRLHAIQGSECVYLVGVGRDPQCVLNLPADVLPAITGGSSFRVQMSPFRLQDRLAVLLSLLIKQVQGPAAAVAQAGQLSNVPQLAAALEAVRGLVQQSLDERDRIIADQDVRLQQQQMLQNQMQQELMRAETQLDLLKDVMLNWRDLECL